MSGRFCRKTTLPTNGLFFSGKPFAGNVVLATGATPTHTHTEARTQPLTHTHTDTDTDPTTTTSYSGAYRFSQHLKAVQTTAQMHASIAPS